MEGYTIIKVPEQTYKSCINCKYLNRELMVSGRNPKYSHDCTHKDSIPVSKKMKFVYGNIGYSDKTPNWCPFLTKTE